MKLTRPAKFSGRGGIKEYYRFLRDMRVYLHLVIGTEKEKILLFSTFLEGDAREWWDLKCRGLDMIPADICTLDGLYVVFAARFEPKTAQESALQELQSLKQGKLPLGHYIDKFRTLVLRSGVKDENLMYRWLVGGLSGAVQKVAVSWATMAARENGPLTIDDLQQFLLKYAEKDVGEPVFHGATENEPDGEPMDIGAVNARRTATTKQDTRDGAGITKDGKPVQQGFRARKCFFCGKPGHILAQCRRLQALRKLEQEQWKRRKEADKNTKGGSPGNAEAPTQTAPA